MSFTTCCPEHPAIARTLATGYPDGEGWARECPQCGGDMSAEVYMIDGVEVCADCFKDWLVDYFSTNADDIADALGVEHHRGGHSEIF